MKFVTSTLFVALAATIVPVVHGHGWIQSIVVDGKTYLGKTPFQLEQSGVTSSPIRQIESNGPVTDMSSSDLTCGIKAKIAEEVIDVKPGSVMSFLWKNPLSLTGNWIHEEGPVTLYIAKCDTTCDNFSAEQASQANWFKIGQLGYSDQKAGTWFQKVVFNGNPLKFQLPSNLAQGDYLLRAEIIALHTATPEIFPSCTQIRISEGSSSFAAPSNSAKFPGAYNPSDASFNYDIYTPPFANYPFPGPALSNVAKDAPSVNGGSNAGTAAAPAGTTPTSSAAADSTLPSTPANVAALAPSSDSDSGSNATVPTRKCKARRSHVPRAELLHHRRMVRTRRTHS